MSLSSILTIFTSIICGAVGAYIFSPAIRASTSSRNKLHSLEYNEEKDILLSNPPPLPSGSSSSSPTTINPENIILSLIIPAYNEEKRLPSMLQHTLKCLDDAQTEIISLCHSAVGLNHPSTHTIIEIIIVSDGSKDQTIAYTQQSIYENPILMKLQGPFHIRFITLSSNRGKGAAVQMGMLQSYGKLCLMVDADGATDFATGIHAVLDTMITMRRSITLSPPSSTTRNHTTIYHTLGLYSVYGSRAHLQQKQQNQKGSSQESTHPSIQRSIIRILLMHGFHFFVRTLCSTKIQDTQCGFKLFTRPVAQLLFQNLHLHRWAFDIELVVMSDLLQIQIEEVSVQWQEMEGSKLATSKMALIRASVDMLRDMICVRLCYSLGIWKIQQ